MEGPNTYDNYSALTDWSKWITGISLFSASGCVTVLVGAGVGARNIANIKLAIIFFLLTVLVSWLIQLAVAINAGKTISPSLPVSSISPILKLLITLEILLFALSCFYLARWVWNFPAAPAVRETVSSVTGTLI